MWHLPRKKILLRKRSGKAAGHKISFAYNATRRKTRICGSSGKDPAPTIIQTLAWHVDLAAAANKRVGPAATHIHISLHTSPRHACCVLSARTEANRAGTAVV